MTSRDRVLRALAHQEPDRVPIDFGGTAGTVIAPSTYTGLRELLGMEPSPPRVFDAYQMVVEVERPVMDRFGADVVMLNGPKGEFGLRLDRWKPWKLPDGTQVEVPADFNPVIVKQGDIELIQGDKVVARMPRHGFHFYPVEEIQGDILWEVNPFALSEVHVQPFTDDDLEFIQLRSKILYEGTDKAVFGQAAGVTFAHLGSVRRWLRTLMEEREHVQELYEKRADSIIENLRMYHEAVGDRIVAIFMAEDLGTQRGSFISPSMFQEVMAPSYRKVFAWIHRHTEWKVFFHSDGSIYELIPYLIDCGIDILNPIQCTALEMEPKRLKAEFGNRLVFWGGGVDTQTVLPFGSVQEVRSQVRKRMEAFAKGGGFVFATVHNILAGVPPENIVAAFDTALEYGRYTTTPGSSDR
jgi:uroporphyrinogen decarboxylase